jgi:CHASE2 domain-containing sensor protein
MPGVLVQAHMVSQILSAVLDQRSLLKPCSIWIDWVWLVGWSFVGSLLASWLAAPVRLGLAIALTALILIAASWIALMQGFWLPVIPSLLGLCVVSGILFYLRIRFQKFGGKQRHKRPV